MTYYTPYIKSSYVKGTMRRQTVDDFLKACDFVNKFKQFAHANF